MNGVIISNSSNTANLISGNFFFLLQKIRKRLSRLLGGKAYHWLAYTAFSVLFIAGNHLSMQIILCVAYHLRQRR